MDVLRTGVVVIEQDGPVVRLRLNRPERYNSIDRETLAALDHALIPASGESRPLLLEGSGPVFSLGADLREMAGFDADAATEYSRLGHQVVARLERWPGVTMAHLTGFVLGAGLELAVGCDVLVADSDLRLGLPGLAWAMMPCLGGLRRLSCRLSSKLCSDLFLRGRILDAREGLDAGLVDRICPDPVRVAELAMELAEFGPGAVRAIRDMRLQRQGLIDPEIEAELFSQPFRSGECQKRLLRLLAG
jgi:enoyl-CoA hydratase/carnithine racemase